MTSHGATYKINCSEASMANLSEICEELFWIFFEEELCNFGVLQAARSAGWWHPAGQSADRLSGFKVLLQPLAHLYEWSLFSMDYCKKKIAILHWLSSAQRARNKAQQSSFHFLQSKQPWCVKPRTLVCWDNVTVPLWHQSSTSLGRNQNQNTKWGAFHAPSSAPSPAEQSENLWPTATTSPSPMSPYDRDTLPLKSYTHSVLKNCLNFVMSTTKCLLFRGFTCNPFLQRNSIQKRRYPISHPMLLLLLRFSRGKHTFKLWLAHETMDNRPLANTFFRGTCNFRHNWECVEFFLSAPWVCFHLLQALCLGIYPE